MLKRLFGALVDRQDDDISYHNIHLCIAFARYSLIFYVGNSISMLQIHVATYVFDLSAGNCHRYIAALSSFIVTHNDRYAHHCTDAAAVTRWRRP
jgi:hypothetical protein